MSDVAMTGSDTVTLNGRNITGLATGDCAVMTFPNNIASVKTGKNGNSIYALNQTGFICEFILRMIRGCADDQYLQSLFAEQVANFAGFALMYGNFIKKIGDGQGNITSDTYSQSGGIFVKCIPAKTNVDGEPEQSISEYTIHFSNAPRSIT